MHHSFFHVMDQSFFFVTDLLCFVTAILPSFLQMDRSLFFVIDLLCHDVFFLIMDLTVFCFLSESTTRGKLNEKLTLIERQLEFLEAQASSANEGFIGEREE